MAFRLNQALGLIARYLKMAAAMRREGMGITVGFASAAQRCPDRPGLVDELGTLTWRQLDERIQRTGRKSKMILLTSGTTGTPKGAKQSGGGAGIGTLKAILDRTPWRAEEPIVIVAPMFPAWGFSQLVFAASSGSRMRPDVVIAFMDQFGDVIYNNYNATEAGMIATATPQDLRAAPDTAGRPAGGTEIRILDQEFNEVPTVRSAASTSATTPNSFMCSGDVGYLDRDGRLFVVGRDDEMIVSGGENVYPIEVEKTPAAHPEVAEAAVIGVDDEQYGQRLAAFVVLESGASATPETLKQHVRQNVANYKVPREIAVLDEPPRGSTGKIVRAELQSKVSSQ
jgi:acyl-CoA synthetase (AMP-forming)/AMP-acid ligase II